MPRHHVQHEQHMGPNLFVCNENIAYIMPRGTTHAVTSYVHCMVHAGKLATIYVYVACQE